MFQKYQIDHFLKHKLYYKKDVILDFNYLIQNYEELLKFIKDQLVSCKGCNQVTIRLGISHRITLV